MLRANWEADRISITRVLRLASGPFSVVGGPTAAAGPQAGRIKCSVLSAELHVSRAWPPIAVLSLLSLWTLSGGWPEAALPVTGAPIKANEFKRERFMIGGSLLLSFYARSPMNPKGKENPPPLRK